MLENTTNQKEEEFFYNVLAGIICNIYSPFEICKDIDFPKKQELGGVVLKFIGSGAAYIKVQSEMPSESEVKSLFEIGKFLKESFGGYVLVEAVCMPHIEIRDINVLDNEDIEMDFISQRKNDGDEILDRLTRKLETGMDFTIDDHILKVMVPFMGRRDNAKFEENYSRFLKLYVESDVELPDIKILSKSSIEMNRWF